MSRDAVGTATLINQLCDSLKNHQVRLYHGSRLTTAELELVRSEGLLPLELARRKPNLVNILKRHPYWNNVEGKLDEALAYFSNGHAEGREDGCVHACFSRQGLLKSCNHYFEYGAEVDGHIVHRLFGENDQIALNLLKSYRKPVLISFLCTFQEAAEAANSWGIPKDNLSSLPGKFAMAWAYKKSSPSFSPATTHDCTAARIKGGIAKRRIESIEIISDSDLEYDHHT